MDHARLPIGPIRQRTAVLSGVVGLALVGFLLVSSVLGGGLDLWAVGVLLTGAALSVVLLLRPSLTLAVDAIHIANPLRRVVVPWHLVEEIRTYWNLEFGTPSGRHTVWAISAARHRPKPRKRLELARDPQDAESIGALVREFHTELAPSGSGGEVSRHWDAVNCALVGVPVAVFVLGVLT